MSDERKKNHIRIVLSTSVCLVTMEANAAIPPITIDDIAARADNEINSSFAAKWQILDSAVKAGSLRIEERDMPAASSDLFAQFRNIAWPNT
ncbi:hypothetical protein HFO24_05045 [Rhizobium laguerreae]|uniref:hypothetical protein n=1 Tax=Rhizobium laguerreae TaxID=1076926 RepID=UPI001C923EEC|nr:hypothetical protein [Rhizobium laguerreae]MBY3181038.1 hypothetical protein [Rhizobium laguerreae]